MKATLATLCVILVVAILWSKSGQNDQVLANVGHQEALSFGEISGSSTHVREFVLRHPTKLQISTISTSCPCLSARLSQGQESIVIAEQPIRLTVTINGRSLAGYVSHQVFINTPSGVARTIEVNATVSRVFDVVPRAVCYDTAEIGATIGQLTCTLPDELAVLSSITSWIAVDPGLLEKHGGALYRQFGLRVTGVPPRDGPSQIDLKCVSRNTMLLASVSVSRSKEQLVSPKVWMVPARSEASAITVTVEFPIQQISLVPPEAAVAVEAALVDCSARICLRRDGSVPLRQIVVKHAKREESIQVVYVE